MTMRLGWIVAGIMVAQVPGVAAAQSAQDIQQLVESTKSLMTPDEWASLMHALRSLHEEDIPRITELDGALARSAPKTAFRAIVQAVRSLILISQDEVALVSAANDEALTILPNHPIIEVTTSFMRASAGKLEEAAELWLSATRHAPESLTQFPIEYPRTLMRALQAAGNKTLANRIEGRLTALEKLARERQ